MSIKSTAFNHNKINRFPHYTFDDNTIIYHNNFMRLQQLLQINLKLLPNKGLSHSLLQAICRHHLLDNKPDIPALVNAFHESIANEQYFPYLLDWTNLFLFNVCAFNKQKITHYENQLLQSTEEGQKFMHKDIKMQIQSISITSQIREALKQWLQQILTLPFFQRIFAQAKSKAVTKSKSLRSLLETIDYLASKYSIKLTQKDNISAVLSTIDRNTEMVLVLQRANKINKRLFAGGEQLVAFLNQVASNYIVNLTQIAQLISANYQNSNPTRRYFESTNNSGEVITQEIIDFLIRTTAKGDLFSQKMDNYRPFELLMEIILQQFSFALIEFNEMIESIMKSPHPCIYSSQNYKKLQTIATVFSYELQHKYPKLHHLIHYAFESLLAKYSPNDSMQLIKKLILNRLLLNPFYYALLNSPNEQDIEKYVKVANQLRILFYQKKMQTIPEGQSTDRLIQHAELLRKSLASLVANQQEEANLPQRIYINDTILGSLFCEVTDSFKLNPHRHNSEMHSESSLSFSLRNESASRMQHPPSHHYITTNQSLPHLPKPSHRTVPANQSQRNTSSQRNTASKVISTQVCIEGPLIQGLQELIALRRQYGELQRQMEIRTTQHGKAREKWKVNLHYLNSPISQQLSQLQRQSKQLLIHNFLL